MNQSSGVVMSETPSSQLAELFPAAYDPHVPWRRPDLVGVHPGGANDKPVHKLLSTRARMILSMELRNNTLTEIAQKLHVGIERISRITRTDRYIEAREALLGRMDHEFMAMKPAAFAAIGQGLRSRDENTALRASETWMRAAGFGTYGKGPIGAQPVTAEDVVKQLLSVNVQVNVNNASERSEPGNPGNTD